MDIISAYYELGSYRAAADKCGTTHRTVKNVVRVLNTRLNLRNRTHLVSWAMRNDLI